MQVIRKVSSAHLIALLALFVALGGSAYAIHLGKNAVKTRNIKNGAVIESKLAGGAVTGAKLADGAVANAKIAAGAVGANSFGVVVVRFASAPLPDGANQLVIASCQPGERLISGAANVSAGNSPDIAVSGTSPTLPNGSNPGPGQSPSAWTVLGNNFPGGDTNTSSLNAYAICLK